MVHGCFSNCKRQSDVTVGFHSTIDSKIATRFLVLEQIYSTLRSASVKCELWEINTEEIFQYGSLLF